jgi:hypothetical protein
MELLKMFPLENIWNYFGYQFKNNLGAITGARAAFGIIINGDFKR